MSYMKFEEQTKKHIEFLNSFKIHISCLKIDTEKYVRFNFQENKCRSEYAYKTSSRQLNNGYTGLITWCRHKGGEAVTYTTYGYPVWREKTPSLIIKPFCAATSDDTTSQKPCLRKIQQFWELSDHQGDADYLRRKSVGAYGIRFRVNQYGRVAVVPMIDVHSMLQGYQILNSDGSKIFAKGMQCSGLFHPLTPLINGLPIGIAESYVTAATCLELTDIQMVTAFTCVNLERVVAGIRQMYPEGPIIMFADNDRHLIFNKGMIAAQEASELAKNKNAVIAPDFADYPIAKEYSDWNDLVRARGRKIALEQISKGLAGTGSKWAEQIVKKLMEL